MRFLAAATRFSVLPIISCTGFACIIVLRLDGQQVLLLRGQRFGTVDGEQRVALFHQLAGEIDEHLVDPAFELAVDLGDLRLVQRHARHGADGVLTVSYSTVPYATPMNCCFSGEI